MCKDSFMQEVNKREESKQCIQKTMQVFAFPIALESMFSC